MASTMAKTVYIGPFVHCKTLQDLDICTTGAIGVNEYGVIEFIERDVKSSEDLPPRDGWQDAKRVVIRDNGFFFPGFVDTHIHASQYPNAGVFGKSTLLDWLNTYTFPTESSFSSLERAKTIYSRIVSRTLSHGTTCASYYATVHVPATNLLSDICLARGQRAFVGRVCMNTLSPDFYRDASVEDAVRDTTACIDHVRRIDPGFEIVSPIITPRFAPSCSADCLAALGKLHHETGVPAQTHVSENLPEIELVQQLFPRSRHYCDVYDQAGLLTPQMVLAHAVHFTPEEVALVRERRSKVSHCPASNTALTSGSCHVRKLLNEGIDIGLGTDVSGGFSPSVLEMVRHAVWVSRHVAMVEGDAAKLTHEEALWLATRGGARVMGLEKKVGGFDVGMEWDAQMISLGRVPTDGSIDDEALELEGNVDVFGWESWEDRVAKWVYNGGDRNTAKVWVRGRLVHEMKGSRP